MSLIGLTKSHYSVTISLVISLTPFLQRYIMTNVQILIPSTPANFWYGIESDPHGNRYDNTRSLSCALGDMAPWKICETFNRAVGRPLDIQGIINGTAHSAIGAATAIKENIRWYSRRLLKNLERLKKQKDYFDLSSLPIYSSLDRLDQSRAKLICGELTDDAIANAVFMTYDAKEQYTPFKDDHHTPAEYIEGAQQRLFWLSQWVDAIERNLLDENLISCLVAHNTTVKTEPYLRRGLKLTITYNGKTFTSTTSRNRKVKEFIESTIVRWLAYEENKITSV